MGILWGYPQDFLWVWDGYGDRNSVPTAALPMLRTNYIHYIRKLTGRDADKLLELAKDKDVWRELAVEWSGSRVTKYLTTILR